MGSRGDCERDEAEWAGMRDHQADPEPQTVVTPRRRVGLPSTCRNINTEHRPDGRIAHPHCGGTLRNGFCQWHPELGDQWEGLR